jgi:hypothetical protein
MSGKRQHILPKLLQKGFASRIDGKTVYTWMYRKGDLPKEVTTTNTIVEQYFYGKTGELSADKEITDLENNKLSFLINQLRGGNFDFQNRKVEIAELVAHLSVRTKLVRKGFQDASEKMFEGVKEIITDEEIIENVFLNPKKSLVENQIEEVLSDSSNEEVRKSLELLKMFGAKEEDVKYLLTELTYSFFNNEESKDENKDFLKNLFSGMFGQQTLESLPNSIKKGHIQSLTTNTVPSPRVDKFKELEWSILNSASPVILGDVGCVFKADGDNLLKPSFDIENINQVYLPISSNQVLVGAYNLKEIETDIAILNDGIAKCSFEQFICSEKTDDKTNLIKLIGTNAYISSDEEIKSTLEEIRNRIEAMGNDN